MYCEFYGFKEKPFTTTPNPRFIFLSKNHKEAFAHLLYGIDHHAGFIELTGEVGTGKTTVLRSLLSQLEETSHRSALILNPCLSAPELLRSINREYGIPWQGLNSAELLDALNLFLVDEHKNGRSVVLVIDEAQNLEPAVLEQLRLVSNLETETTKLIQIILAGQPELRQLLRRPELRQVGQRVSVTYHLQPMDFTDTCNYIEHRLEVAGGWKAATFVPAALKKLYQYSGGIPRLLNIACDRALLIGYTEESREISAPMAARAIIEVRGDEPPRYMSRRWLTAVAVAVAMVGSIAFWGWRSSATPAKRASRAVAATDFLPAVSRELASISESASNIKAFNALAALWQAPPAQPPPSDNGTVDLELLARERSLQLLRFSGSLGLLQRIGSPAVLEITPPGATGKRYLAITGMSGDRLQIMPALLGRSEIGSSELESIWSGRGYLLWRNFHSIPTLVAAGTRGDGVSKLQQLLKRAGVMPQEPTGIFDKTTIAAVRKFQSSQGVTADGRVGNQTLLLLYRVAGQNPQPSLQGLGGNNR